MSEDETREADDRGSEATRVGTAIGSAEAGAGVAGGDVGRADAPGGSVGGTAESRASVPGETEQADSSEVDAQAFAQATRKGGTQAGLAGGYGALDAEGDEGRPA